ncbi:MAG: hypothetical protein Fur0018_00370 [Anaerolineales bacterium]
MSRKTKSQYRGIAPQQRQGSLSGQGINTATSFSPDYSYIVRDLKRIGSLAGLFLMLLLIGSFFVK